MIQMFVTGLNIQAIDECKKYFELKTWNGKTLLLQGLTSYFQFC